MAGSSECNIYAFVLTGVGNGILNLGGKSNKLRVGDADGFNTIQGFGQAPRANDVMGDLFMCER